MKCRTEEFHLEGTEDCWSGWAPPHHSQFVVACDWGSDSFHPDASSLCYGARFSTCRFQSKQLILGRMQ
jgi:hypothetical protein